MTFIDRLIQAAKHAGVGERQSAIADALQVKRQTVSRWFVLGGVPQADLTFHIAKRFGVDPNWLRTGEGEMVPEAANSPLSTEELALIRDYRKATPKVRQVIVSMARAARKVAVVMTAFTIPPLLSSPEAQAGSILHNQISHHSPIIHIVQQWLRAAVAQVVRLRTGFSIFA